jgi:hypothetical protein
MLNLTTHLRAHLAVMFAGVAFDMARELKAAIGFIDDD